MPKTIVITLLLFGVSAFGQAPIVQPSSIIISFIPAPNSASARYPAGIVRSITSPQRSMDKREVLLLSNNDGHVIARTFTDRNGQFRFLNLVQEIFDVVVRIEGFESARVTRVTAGATVTVPVTLARKLMARLAVLVPAPRVNLIKFDWLTAPAAKWRADIVPAPPEDSNESDSCECGDGRSSKKNAGIIRGPS